MTTKLVFLTGLLLALSGQAFADQAPPPVQTASAESRSVAQAPAPQVERLAWQRVGSPISLEG